MSGFQQFRNRTKRQATQIFRIPSATSRLLFNMLGTIAQFETELRAERQLDGIRKAKERGVPPPLATMTEAEIMATVEAEIADARAARQEG